MKAVVLKLTLPLALLWYSQVLHGAPPMEEATATASRADVTHFGAVPNDNKDDTDAIERAVQWAGDRKRHKQLRPRGSSAVVWGPSIYFPTGRYQLKRQIRLGGSSSLSADAGKAVIEWVDDPETDEKQKGSMFWFHCYTNTVENLKFVGGKTQLHFQNPNTNQTLIDISGCEFQHATGIAVRATPAGEADHLSTVLTIRNCKFEHNYQCLETYCDITKVVDTWVEFFAPFCAMNEAVFVNRSGRLMFDNMVGVPGVCKNTEAMKQPHTLRWVDNYASFSAVFSRFGGEGAGMPVVHNYAKYSNTYPYCSGGTIDLTHSSVNAGSMREDAAVIRLFAVPTQVTIRDCRMVNAPIFRVDPSLDLDAWKESVPQNRRQFRYVIQPNYTHPRDLHENIPAPLREFLYPPPATPSPPQEKAEPDTGIADVTQFGAKGDGKQDDGPAIQAAVAFVRVNRKGMKQHTTTLIRQPELYFPPGLYRITEALDIGGVNVVRGSNAALIQASPDKAIFTSRSAYRMRFTGLAFSGGRTHLELWNKNINMGHIVVRDCSFNDSFGPAVNLLSGAQSTDLLIESCMFRHCEQALITHTDITKMKDSWIQTGAGMAHKAVIEHRGQKLFLDNITGVPLVNGQDQRWIDCYGSSIAATGCRFGGEGGGFTPVVNWKPEASISILDSTIAAEGNAQRRTVVYMEEMVTMLIVRGCSMRTPPFMISPNVDLKTCFLNDALVYPVFDVATNRMPAFTLPEQISNPIVGPLPVDNLSEEATQARMAEILALEKAFAQAAAGRPAPAGALPITPSTHQWDLGDVMDTLVVKNADYLALARGPAGTILLKRCGDRWPHVLIRDIQVDLATHPILSWVVPDRGDCIEGHSYSVKIVDRKTGQTTTLQRRQVTGDTHSHDLRPILKSDNGKAQFDLKFYYLGYGPYNDPTTGEVVNRRAGKGEYMVLESLFLEKQ